VVWWVPLGLIAGGHDQGHDQISASRAAQDQAQPRASRATLHQRQETIASRAILHQRQETIDIPRGAQWIKLNHANAGLFRVCYSPDALRCLARAMERGELQTGDVVGILNDTVALVVSGYVRTSVLLDLLGSFAMAAGDSYVVWQIIGAFLENLNQTWAELAPPAVCARIVRLARSLFGPKAAALGWAHRADDGPLVARLRSISIPRAGWAGDPLVVAQACQLFDELYAHPDECDRRPFHHDFTASVLEIAVRSGPPINHARVREMYENSQRWSLSEDQRMAALGAMASAPSAAQKTATLEYAMSDAVLPQDLNIVVGYMVAAAAADSAGKHVLWHWFAANYARVVARLGESSALLGHVVGAVVGSFATYEMADAVEAWFRDKPTAAFDRMLPQSLEFVRVRAA
ncbi:hypothetical protein EV175_006714, partial [Coemansia sp. RSA 1933]